MLTPQLPQSSSSLSAAIWLQWHTALGSELNYKVNTRIIKLNIFKVPGLPSLGAFSAAISVSCHRRVDDADAANLPLNWGVVETEVRPGIAVSLVVNEYQ